MYYAIFDTCEIISPIAEDAIFGTLQILIDMICDRIEPYRCRQNFMCLNSYRYV